MIPPVPQAEMRLPSLYFRIKGSDRVGIAEEPHWDGVHFRLKYDLWWYTLEELEPVTEADYNAYVAHIKEEALKANRP